jgi:hypothetical protein
MVLWISVGLIAGSLLLLAASAARTLGRLTELRRAARRAQVHQGDRAGRTRAKLADLQATLELLQLRAMRTSEQAAMLKAARAGDRPGALAQSRPAP